MPNFLTQSTVISLASAALIVPYLILSPLGGRLSVKYSKQKVFRLCKLAEFPIMAIAAFAFYFHSIWLAIFAVLVMGIQSCLYSPSKYGLIRDIGGEKGIAFGNGIFEMMAFLGILSGTVLASLIADNYSFSLTAALFLGFALFGYLSTSNIRVKELEPENITDNSINPFKFAKESYFFAKNYSTINLGVFGVSIFWLVGGLIQMNLVIHCLNTLQTTNTAAGLIMATAAVGIAVGCSLAGKFSNGEIKKNMIFAGLFGMTAFLLGIAIFNPPPLICAIMIFLTAFCCGFFEVPCLTMVQKPDTGRKIGDMLAYMNLTIFIFILIGSTLFFIITQFISDNSLIVFAVTAGICLVTLIMFLIKMNKTNVKLCVK